AAKDSCRQGALEEKKLIIQRVDELCEALPPEIITDIYPHLNILKSSTNNNTACDISQFDTGVGEIVNIIISYDMGWSKRGNGRSYDSLNGYGTIIGFLSGKILDFSTRNRAKAMEPSVGSQLVNNSCILREAGLKVKVVIGDEYSSTMAAIRRGNDEQIHKLADSNHLRKNFSRDLYNLQTTYKEMRHKDTIPHIKKCFSYAIDQNRGKSADLAETLRSIPDHLYGRHENCGVWCQRKIDIRFQKVILHDIGLYNDLKNIFKKYADNAPKFSVVASSQDNESLNNIMAHKAPKNNCYCLSESADFRLASAVASKNNGDSYVMDVKKILSLSPGKNTKSYIQSQDHIRKKRAMKAKLALMWPHRKITGLKNIRGRLYVHDKEVHTLSIKEALVSFLQFLMALSSQCLLVAHNARFDSSHLIYAIMSNNMVDAFSSVLVGFIDTLTIFKKYLPERKGRDMFKLEQLAKDILQINSTTFHDATYDVEILNKLVTVLVTRKEVLIQNHKSYIDLVRKAMTLPSLRVLEGPVSSSIIEKLATDGIGYEKLSEVHRTFGQKGITDLLSQKKMDNKPLITNCKK
ncbi:hypothetical protein PV325_010197, partial [Microctonus aethiopoides]